MKQYHVSEVREKLWLMSQEFESDADCARAIGISRSHMSRLMGCQVKPGKKVLDWMGMSRVVIYVDNKGPI